MPRRTKKRFFRSAAGDIEPIAKAREEETNESKETSSRARRPRDPATNVRSMSSLVLRKNV